VTTKAARELIGAQLGAVGSAVGSRSVTSAELDLQRAKACGTNGDDLPNKGRAFR
jgi:hypothetical protein